MLAGPCVPPVSLTCCAPGNAFTGPPANGSAVLLIAGQGLRLEANSCGSSVSHCAQSGIPIATVVGALDGALGRRLPAAHCRRVIGVKPAGYQRPCLRCAGVKDVTLASNTDFAQPAAAFREQPGYLYME